MAEPVTHFEIYSLRSTDSQLKTLLSSFKIQPTFISVAMWNLMFSLFGNDIQHNKYLQRFFINNLIRPEVREKTLGAASLESQTPRPVFGRWQLLALMKKVLVESSGKGPEDPRQNFESRFKLGDACLMLNELLFTQEQDERLTALGSKNEREQVHDELMVQWLPQFELINTPDVYQAIARNDEYFNIFDQSPEFGFADEQSLAQRFVSLTDLNLRQYLRLYFAVYILHSNLQLKHPSEINDNPSIINFDKDVIFSMMDLSNEEQSVFFQRVLNDLERIINDVARDMSSTRMWQYDLTTFRNAPLVYNSDSKRGFTCLDHSFLVEKLASGVYHTLLNSWPQGAVERGDFQRNWGKVFERFVNDRLADAYPSSILIDRFYGNPHFNDKQHDEVSDAILDYGNAMILMEHKGGYLSADEKYSGDANKLLTGVGKKFGLNRGIKQLAQSIGKIFHRDPSKRVAFSSSRDATRVRTFTVDDNSRVKKVYPVLIVQDFAMALGFMNRRLRLQFAQRVENTMRDLRFQVMPLSLLTIEDLENALEHLNDVSLTEVLNEYAREEHEPITTFGRIFEEFLKVKGIEMRRYEWSTNRCTEILDSIKFRFIRQAADS